MHFFWWWLSAAAASGTIARLGTPTATYATLGTATTPGPIADVVLGTATGVYATLGAITADG